jgi:DNA polymerase I
MELKERTTLYPSSWDSAWNETETEWATLDLDEPEAARLNGGSALAGLLSEPDFLPDAAYIDLYRRYQAKRQAEREEALAKARAQAQVIKAAAAQAPKAPPPPTPKATANGANGKSNGKENSAPATRKPSRNRNGHGLIASENFKGDYFPVIPVTSTPPIIHEVVKDNAGLLKAVEELRHCKVLAVDTETTGLDPYDSKLLLVQIASPEKCYIIDAQAVKLDALKPLLEGTQALKLLQNAKFDYEMLKQQAGVELDNIYDTMLAERLLTAGRGLKVGLAELTERNLKERLHKSVRKTFYGANSSALTYMSADQLNYAAKDALVLFPIYAMQLEKLKTEQLLTVAEVEFKCVMAVGDLELNGCKLDTVKWRQILAGVETKRDQARIELMEILPGGRDRQASMFGGDEYMINLNSGPQIINEFKKLGIEIQDTSEATLSKCNHEAAKKLLEYRGYEKTLGSFGEGLLALIHKKTGRIHPDFIQYGADTGRFSCSNPNVQQIPATSDFRACFIPEEGYKLVTCDYSQAELRILAELSQDDGFLGAFKSGGDLHILAASQMFNIPPEQVTKVQRGQAKAINFGLAYGMGPQGLSLRIDKTVEEARDLISAYFKAFSGVQKWLEKAGRDSVKNGYVATPLGRKRYFDVPQSSDPDHRKKMSEIERQGKNAPIQGANADMTKIALVFLREKLRGYDARVVNTVHDEIVVEVCEEQAEEVCKLVEAQMIRAAQEILKEVPVVADAKVGSYWSK